MRPSWLCEPTLRPAPQVVTLSPVRGAFAPAAAELRARYPAIYARVDQVLAARPRRDCQICGDDITGTRTNRTICGRLECQRAAALGRLHRHRKAS